ncbi:MAG: hypothetical protein APF80_05165 [Alphaproteobacteria bacterium BRH_c36]|nr:MAG: hypothetical protein APF80_05165 [Alphaproteobacteria bacterium BRH_c36]
MSDPNTLIRTVDHFLENAGTAWYQRQVLFALLIIIGVWCLVFQQVTDERSSLRRSVTDNLSNIAVTLSHNITRTSGELDTLLQFMRAMRRSKSSSVSWQEIITEDYTLNRHTVQIAVIDKNGMMVTSTKMLRPEKPVDLSDREHYRVHRDGSGDNLFISRPVLGRASGKWSVQYTRPLLDERGKFDGVIVVSLDPDKLTRIYSHLDLGKQGGVVIIGDDNIIRAGTGDYASMLGKTLVSSAHPFTQAGPAMAVTTEIEHREGTMLIAAKTPVEGYPLRVVVLGGSSWMFKIYIMILCALLLTGLTVYATFAAIRTRLRESTLLEEQNRFLVEKQVAEAASKTKGEFLAVMSHEIRTPLNGVLGALDLIKTEPLTQSAARHLEIASSSGEYLLSLIDDILVFSKLEDGQFKFEESPQSLKEIFASLESMFRPLTEKAGNELLLEVSDEIPASVMVDAVRLRQVLINLLSNANKFTSKGTISLSGSLLEQNDGQATLHFAITDTGIGIPADKQSLIFEKFKSLDSTFSRRTDGTGLGLAICDEIIRAMGGHIKVDSEYGKGSRFSFALTFRLATEPAASSAIERTDDKPPRQLRILFAEDNPTNAYIGTQYLVADGHAVTHAENGIQAVDHAGSKRYDLIFMDISMPEKDGLTAAREIRDGDGPNKQTPIVALTAHAVPGTGAKVTEAGMNAYLTKPIRRAKLLEAARCLATPASLTGEQSTAADEPVIELADLADFFEDRRIDETSPLMGIFVAELSAKRDALLAVAEAGDARGAGLLAHAIFGSASTVGAARLANICKSIECRAESPETFDWSTAESAIQALDDTVAEFQSLIAKKMAVKEQARAQALTA